MSKNITTRCGSMFGLGMRVPRKSRDKTRTLRARVLMCFVWFCELFDVWCVIVCITWLVMCYNVVCLVISTWMS